MKFKQIIFIFLCLLLAGCGKVFFSARTEVTSDVDIPVILLNTNFYAEIGQEVPKEIEGDFTLTLAKILSAAKFTGAGQLEFEVRLALTGDAKSGEVNVTGTTEPQGWANGTVIFNQNIDGGNILNPLESSNIASVVTELIKQGFFWIDIRVRYAGPGTPNTATIQNTYVYVEGEKNLKSFAPLINLGF